MSADPPYNPLDKKNLGKSVADAILDTEPQALDHMTPFAGAGIYGLYYVGEFKAYRLIAEQNRENKFEQPIYVGKAVPPGARKGGLGLDAKPGNALFKRIGEHADSIRQTKLSVEDFYCRYLAVEDIWIPLGESLLIARFAPVWNKLIDGFGNHDPGKGRYGQLRSRWDVLHPGRAWAERCQKRQETAKQIIVELGAYLRDALG